MKIRITVLILLINSTVQAGIFDGLENHQANLNTFNEVRAMHQQTLINIWKEKNKVTGELFEGTNKLTAIQKEKLKNRSSLLDCTMLYVQEKQLQFNNVMKAYGHYKKEHLAALQETNDVIDRLNDNKFVCAEHEEDVWRIYSKLNPIN